MNSTINNDFEYCSGALKNYGANIYNDNKYLLDNMILVFFLTITLMGMIKIIEKFTTISRNVLKACITRELKKQIKIEKKVKKEREVESETEVESESEVVSETEVASENESEQIFDISDDESIPNYLKEENMPSFKTEQIVVRCLPYTNKNNVSGRSFYYIVSTDSFKLKFNNIFKEIVENNGFIKLNCGEFNGIGKKNKDSFNNILRTKYNLIVNE